MTLFAGIFSRHAGQPIPDALCDGLRRAVSRHPADEAREFRDARSFFVKTNIGAFGEPAFHVDVDGSVSVLAGEPLLGEGDARQSREQDLLALHLGWKREDYVKLLSRARGVFCAAHYQPQTGKLFLISDKLGVRPLYYWADERFVIFATALRVLESLEIPKELDLRGVTELIGLGYPLGSRTPYANISLIKAAEVVTFTEKNVQHECYWRWDELQPSRRAEAELLDETYEAFMRGVALRNRSDKTSVAYLSGGLDSRCAVAALLQLGVRVHTFNFALPGTQDLLFGNDFASAAGTLHEAVPKEQGDLTPDYSSLMARAWHASKFRKDAEAERPSVVWSGEGGSVAFGHVHLSPSIAEHMRQGRTNEAIETFLKQEGASVTRRLLREEAGANLGHTLHTGISEELEGLNRAEDPARSFYLFLLLNDQRRKLSAHFENIDLHRLEFQLPFFDAEFLARVISVPVDLCLRHKFYTKWLKLFASVVTEIGWQSYPGHEPCPINAPQGMAYQWDESYQAAQSAVLKRELLKQAREMLGSREFPKEILSKSYLRIAALIYQAGVRDYSYVIQSAWKYHTYWKLCGGKYALPSLAGDNTAQDDGTRSNGFKAEAELTVE